MPLVVFGTHHHSFITPFRDDDDEEGMDIAGINLKVILFISIISNTRSLLLLPLQEESAHFLPTAVVDMTSRSCSDETFISPTVLRDRVQKIGECCMILIDLIRINTLCLS